MTGRSEEATGPANRVLSIGTTLLFVGLGLALAGAGLWNEARTPSVVLGLGGLWLLSVGARMRAKARKVLRLKAR